MTVDQPEAALQAPANLLHCGRALPAEQCLQIAAALSRQVDQLHQQGQIHGQIDAEHVQFETGPTPQLVPRHEPLTFGGVHSDLERCPPELDVPREVTLPTDLQQAQAKLRSAGIGMDARRIDVYQIGALLCRLATGGSVQAYADSPRIKSSVAATIRAVLDQTLGFDSSDRIQSCDELLRLLKSSVGWVPRPDQADAQEDESGDSSYKEGQPQEPEATDTSESAADTPNEGTVEETLFPTIVFPVEVKDSPSGETSELTHLKHYRLLEVIGRGGMGVVYRAQDELLDRTVAVKLLRQDLVRDESFLKRFQAEAEAAAGLHHPNIAAVYDNGEDQGRRFFAMQLIEGESLLELLRREGKLDVAEAVAVITQCLSALDAAHAEGLVHRDVKPGNVLLEAETGRAYLADFGLVRRMDAQTRVTMTGVIVGTTDYIPPEQARGQELDGRADLYSLGVMFYQMLSGRLPFIADTPTAMVFQHAREEPFPLDEAAPDLPPPLVELINRLLAKDPEDRPGDCHEVIEALSPYHPLPSRTRQLTNQVSAILMAAEPDSQTLDFALDQSYGPWQKARDRAATLFRRHTPDWIDALRTTGQHLEGAVAFCERRRRRLLALRHEGKSLLKEFDEQIKAASEERVAGDERSKPSENNGAEGSLCSTSATRPNTKEQSPADSDDQPSPEDAQQAGEQQLAAIQTERNQIGQQIESLDLELAKVDARLAGLRSQQVALENRLAALQPSSSKKPTAAIAAAASILLMVGVFTGLLAIPSFRDLFKNASSKDVPVPQDRAHADAPEHRTVQEIVIDVPTYQPGEPWAEWPADAPPPAVAPFDSDKARQYQENWAKYLGVTVEKEIDLGGGQKLTMVLIPPGEFQMGSSAEERARFLKSAKERNATWVIRQIPAECPQHRVRITKPFWLSRHEVTIAQFRQFVEETGYKTDAERDGNGGYSFIEGKWVRDPRFVWHGDIGLRQTDLNPVVCVTWHDAAAYCRWLSEKHRLPFALPTEAQWEYACRAGTTTIWHSGESEVSLQEFGWTNRNSDRTTHPVGRLRPNQFRLRDMHGNVWEWCADWYAVDYYSTSPVDNPGGQQTGSRRVCRGGAWLFLECGRSAFRNGNTPDHCSDCIGFRLAMGLEEVPPINDAPEDSVARSTTQAAKTND